MRGIIVLEIIHHKEIETQEIEIEEMIIIIIIIILRVIEFTQIDLLIQRMRKIDIETETLLINLLLPFPQMIIN